MDATREIHDALSTFVGKRMPTAFALGKVKSYNATNETVVITDLGSELDTYDVSLRSIVNDDTEGVVVVPKLGSMVIVGRLSDGLSVVVQFSKVERIKGKIGQLSFLIDTNGVHLQRGTDNLKGVLDDMLDELSKSFIAINGLLGVPVNTPQYLALKTRLNQLLT